MKRTLWIPRRMFYRVLWPSLVSALALAMADIADALVVGSRVGEKGLAAIGIVTPVYMLYNLIGYGFSGGGCVTHGQLTAEGRNEAALCHFRLLTIWILSGAIAFAFAGNVLARPFLALLGVNENRAELLRLCEDYARPLLAAAPVFMLNFILYDFVRCDDNPSLATLGFSLGCAVDLGLNILLVIVLNKGVRGSIIATVTAQAVSVAVLLMHLFNRRGILRWKAVFHARGERKEIRKLSLGSLKIGFSSSMQYIFQFVFLFLANRLLLRAGDLGLLDGDLYVAVFDVVMNVSFMALALYQATAGTMQPLVATFTEEHDLESRKYVLSLATFWGLGLGMLFAGLLAVFAGPVSGFFGLKDGIAQAVSVPAIRIFCLSTPFAGYLIILTGYYQSSLNSGFSSLITSLRSAVILLPVTLLFGLLFPVRFWWLFPACEMLSLLILVIRRFAFRMEEPERIPVFSASMDNSNHELPQLLGSLESFCEEQEIPMKKAMFIQLAVEELCLVTMQKAFTGKPDEYIQVTLTRENEDDYKLYIRNSAPQFNPFMLKMERMRQDTEEELMDSVGVLMVRERAKSLHYRNYEGFNVLRVII